LPKLVIPIPDTITSLILAPVAFNSVYTANICIILTRTACSHFDYDKSVLLNQKSIILIVYSDINTNDMLLCFIRKSVLAY